MKQKLDLTKIEKELLAHFLCNYNCSAKKDRDNVMTITFKHSKKRGKNRKEANSSEL